MSKLSLAMTNILQRRDIWWVLYTKKQRSSTVRQPFLMRIWPWKMVRWRSKNSKKKNSSLSAIFAWKFTVHSEWTTIIWQNCKLDGDVITGRNSLGSKAMDYISDILKVCCKSNQLLQLFKNATTLQLPYILNYLNKPQGLMKPREKMKYLTNHISGAHNHLECIYLNSVSEVITI